VKGLRKGGAGTQRRKKKKCVHRRLLLLRKKLAADVSLLRVKIAEGNVAQIHLAESGRKREDFIFWGKEKPIACLEKPWAQEEGLGNPAYKQKRFFETAVYKNRARARV